MDKFFNKDFSFDRTVRILFALLLLFAVLFGLSVVWEVLCPFLLAGIFAYACMPMVHFFQDTLRLRYRGLAVTVVFILIFSLFTLSLLYLVPAIEEEISKTLVILSEYSGGKTFLEMLIPESVLPFIKENIDIKELAAQLSLDKMLDGIKSLLGQAESIITGTLSVFSWGIVFAMGIVYFIFILLDFEGLGQGILGLFPKSAHSHIKEVGAEMDYYMNNYFRGQGIIALSVAVILTVGFNLISLPMATAMAIFIGLLNFIPYMQILGVLPLGLCAILMSIQTGRSVFLCFLLAFGILALMQIIQDTLIVPRVMGHRMGIRPSLVLLSLSIWGYVLGFFGLLIALPTTMILYSLYMRYVLEDDEHIKEIEEKTKKRKKVKA